MPTHQAPEFVGPQDGKAGRLGSIGVRFMIDTEESHAGDEPCRILEIIAPGGFEKYFDELVDAGAAGRPDPEWIAALGARYGLEFDFASIPVLCDRFGLTFG